MKSIPISSTPLCQLRNGHNAYEYMGAHPVNRGGVNGWQFRVWAPNAQQVSVVGSFNCWSLAHDPMIRQDGGIWSAFIAGPQQFDLYQFAILTQNGRILYKADPYAFHADTRPNTASKLFDLSQYQWGDQNWMAYRARQKRRPLNIYELHLGSWRRTGNGEMLNYRVIASYLVPYVKSMGYTHVLLMPPMEHPRDSSFGYQITGYFAATSRLGTPTDLMYLIDQLHQAGVGVFVDWNPGNTPSDDSGLCSFDGTPCYERPEYGSFFSTFDFDFSKPEVCEFLTSALLFWIEKFHVDGTRILSVPRDGAGFFIKLGRTLRKLHPEVLTIRPNVPGTKEDLMTDLNWPGNLLECLRQEMSQRKGPVFDTGSVLPDRLISLGHQLVTPSRSSVAARMYGDDWTRFSTVRAFYLVFLTRPGHKLTMMGTEFGQWSSWQYQQSLDWHLLNYLPHQQQQAFFRQINALYLTTPAFWGDNPLRVLLDSNQSCLTVFVRTAPDGSSCYVAANFTANPVEDLLVDVPDEGCYEVIFSTDDPAFGGHAETSSGKLPVHYGPQGPQLAITLPPNTAIIFKRTEPIESR